ncbi:hypothetical protein K4F52_007325 [Lecanicillium sp. MT-2017a]|nr:hypothetical protein K4F52_007325 [Lecanicillium sp. MT-2017a]
MARESDHSSEDESDHMLAAVEAQQRIIELKRNRDKRTSEVTAKANAALDDIVARVKKRVHEFEQEKNIQRGKKLEAIQQLAQQQRALEVQMTTIVEDMHASIVEVEEMMKAGYKGREQDMKDACAKQRSK